jgi:hypothetical protein
MELDLWNTRKSSYDVTDSLTSALEKEELTKVTEEKIVSELITIEMALNKIDQILKEDKGREPYINRKIRW